MPVELVEEDEELFPALLELVLTLTFAVTTAAVELVVLDLALQVEDRLPWRLL